MNVLSVSLQKEHKAEESSRHWRDLEILLQKSPTGSTIILQQPAPAPLPDNPCINRLRNLCKSRQQQNLLDRHLLGSALLFTSPDRKLLFLSQSKLIQEIFPKNSDETLLAADWISFPIPVTQGTSSKLLTCFAGFLPGKNDSIIQSSPHIDKSSREAILTALQLQNNSESFHNGTLFFWTLADSNAPPLRGKSSGLATALALHLLKQNRPWPNNFYATGTLSEQGYIETVSHIARKQQVLNMKYEVFIIPRAQQTFQPDPRCIAAENLKEAVLILELFMSRQNNITVSLCLLAAKDPNTLLKQFDQLPDQFFTLFELTDILKELRRNPEKYLGLLAACLRKNSYRIQHSHFLDSLPLPEEIIKLDEEHILDCINYCLGQLACWNHLGAPGQSAKWSKCILDISASSTQKKRSQFSNNDFVRERFNRFDFRPDPPTRFTNQLKYEKELHEFQQEDSWQLGAMYGTLAQNYGFCGPAFSKNLKNAAQNACSAFGRTYKREQTRIYSYLIYGLLDSRQWMEAQAILPTYLMLSKNITNIWPDNFVQTEQNRHQYNFQFCLLCRFLADMVEHRQISTNPDNFTRSIPRTLQKTSHPWQFTAVNLARLCLHSKQRDQARKLLQHSISICTPHGDTMHALALLPLAILHHHGLAEKTDLQLARKIINRIQTRKTLDQSHFHPLFNHSSGEKILIKTMKFKEELFPFSYR